MASPNKKIAKALTPARQLALLTFLLMQARNEKVQSALNTTLAEAPATAGQKDKALCTELVYGCIRLEIRLDWILNKFFKKPNSVPNPLRRVMRMAVYELFYLSHIPSYATVSSYVTAIKSGYGQTLAGVANAMLRNISNIPAHDRAWFEAEISDEQEFKEVWYSLPSWIVKHFTHNYPADEAEKYMLASLESPPLGLRPNLLTPNKNEVIDSLKQGESLLENVGNAFAFATGKAPKNLTLLLGKGELSRQSYAVQTIMQKVFSELKKEVSTALKLGPIWDICAGQGGKTCWLLENGLPVELASDTSTMRLKHLQHELVRLKLPTPAIIVADASSPLPVKSTPGIILADTPCSGLGTLSRRPDIKLYRKPEDLNQLATLQEQIITTQFKTLPAGGLLIYLTCTLNPTENHQIIDKLAKNNTTAKMIFSYQSPPENIANEFFWVAVLTKTES